MQNILSRVRNPALRYGILVGVILGIVLIAIGFLNLSSLGAIVPLLLTIAAGFLAGRQASQQTGRTITGALSGVWTGLIGSFIPFVLIMILVLVNINSVTNNINQSTHSHYTNSDIIVNYLLSYGLFIVVGVLFALAGGVIGGTMGRSRWRQNQPPPQEYEEAMFEPPQPKTPAE